MLFDLIREEHSDKLCDASQDQIRMKCFLILCIAAGNPKVVFEVVDKTFYSDPDLICIIPFLSPPYRAGIST